VKSWLEPVGCQDEAWRANFIKASIGASSLITRR